MKEMVIRKTRQVHPWVAVVRREGKRLASRWLYLLVCGGLPLFSLFFMATIFGSGQMDGLPIGVVDLDNSALSRSVIRRLEAVPTFRLTHHYWDETQARRAVQRKEIYGYLSIPFHFQQRVEGGEQVTISYYYHYALMAVGGELMAAFETTLAPVAVSPLVMNAVDLGTPAQRMRTFLLPVQSDIHPVYNPALNYTIYLSPLFFFVFFQILILLTTVYGVGIEIKFRTATDWLATAHGNIAWAVFGKLFPYFLLYSLIAVIGNGVMYGILGIPFEGNWWLLNGVTLLFVLATQSLGLFLFSAFPVLPLVISVVSMVGSLGATLSGITFPIANTYLPVQLASYLFPVKYFTEAVQTMLYAGGGWVDVWQQMAVLCLFPCAACGLLPRLQQVISHHTFDKFV